MHSPVANVIAAGGRLIADSVDLAAREVLFLGGAAPAALVLVGARPGLSLEELRRPLALSQPGAVRLVDRLEARRWVERRRGDGRRLALHLTPGGRRLTQQLLAEQAKALAALVASLSDVEQAELVRLLEKMLVARVVEHGDRERLCRLCSRAECADCGVAAAADATEERARRLSELDLQLRLETTASEEELARLLADADRAGDEAAAASARARLGLAAMARAEYDEVIAHLERARDYLSPLDDPLAIAALARAYSLSGRSDDAVALLEDALADVDARAPDNAVAWVRFDGYLSYALTDDGRYAEARPVVREAFRRSKGVRDFYTWARVHWSAARLAMFERDLPAAERHFTRAIRLLERSEDDRLLGRAHISRAMIRTLAGRLGQARGDLRRAEALLGSHPDSEDLYWMRIERARHAVASGEVQAAVALAREALELVGTDAAARGAAHAVLGRALAARGDVEGADAALSEAVAALRARREWYAAAEAAHAWTEALDAGGRASDAERARQVAAQLAADAAAASRGAPRRARAGR
jgi:MarR family transcriptional regulator, negative regulator of the multidrug operon emrRAB